MFLGKTEPANAIAVPGHIWPPPLILFSLPDLLRKGTNALVRAAQKVQQLPVSTLPSGLFFVRWQIFSHIYFTPLPTDGSASSDYDDAAFIRHLQLSYHFPPNVYVP